MFDSHFRGFVRVWLFVVVCAVSVMIGLAPAVAARKSAAMAVDAHTGKILYSHNIDKLHHPASLTKIMTLYMLFEFIEAGRLDLSSPLKVTAHAASQQPSKLGLKPGSTIRVDDAIRALIVKSANDVAVTVAENIAGSEWKFAQLMTWKARKMGMSKTVFKNASGLPDRAQVTTARDMIKLAQRINQDFPTLYPFFATKRYKHKGRVYRNYNRLMSRMQGIDGIKTGYTRASGYNLTSSIWRGRKHVYGVVLGGKTSKRRDAFMQRLLNKALRKASNGPRKKIYQIAKPKKQLKEPIVVATANPKKLVIPPQKLGALTPAKGPYHIQIGAFGSKEDAQTRLATIGSKVGNLLKGHDSFTMPVPNQTLYRARFAGFSEQDARKTCQLLKRRAITCLAVPAY